MKIRRIRFSLPVLALACLGCIGFALADDSGKSAGAALAFLPMIGIPGRKMDQFNPDNHGGGAESAFQRQVLAGIGKVAEQVTTIEGKFTTLDAEAKKLAEDLANQSKSFEGLPAQVEDVSRTLEKIQLKVSLERRSHFGSALDVITSDEQMRSTVNGVIRMAANPTGQRSIPLSEDQKKGATDFARALSSGSGPGAGYIDDQLLPAIYGLIAENGIWRGFDVTQVGSASAKMIVDTSDPVMEWTEEGAAPTEASYAGGNVTATIKKLLGWISVPNELLEDSTVDLASYLLPKFANATAKALDWACTSADGTADVTDGGHTGIFVGGTAAVAASGNVSVATLDYEDFLKAMLAVNAAALSKPCKWWIHPQMLIRALSIKDLNGRPIFLPSIDAPSFGAIGSILGYPVVLSHTAPNTDGTSKAIATFGDPMGLGICLRKDFQFAASDQVQFKEDKTVFRARARGAAKIKQATAFGVLTTAAS